VLYFEKRSTGEMVPRAIMNDFRDNFGNFSACFALEQQSNQPDYTKTDRFGNPLEETKGDASSQWQGNI